MPSIVFERFFFIKNQIIYVHTKDVNWKPEIRFLVLKLKISSISLLTGFRIYFFVIFVKEIT